MITTSPRGLAVLLGVLALLCAVATFLVASAALRAVLVAALVALVTVSARLAAGSRGRS